ncbi:leucine-rich repeat domain-containing protein [Ruminococcus flavefaciens]|uniref:leucine-rich repeat domain-containing protein n=1 Tax=Ruminococcus flavefaciens TaxID=1265 RepID=UPI0026F1C0F7|nr:leucine-rich repeat domain-containing protein [Ruminococcus flavefaciens]
MAFYSGFFNSKGLDRTYTAEDFTSYLSSIICNGILDTYGQNFKLTAASSGLKVNLGTGKAWIDGHYFINDARYSIDLTSYQDESLPRYVAIAILLDVGESVRSVSLEITPGTPAENPSLPSLPSDENKTRLLMYAVRLNPGATELTERDWYDYREDKNVCGYCKCILGKCKVTELMTQMAQLIAEVQENNETIAELTNKVEQLEAEVEDIGDIVEAGQCGDNIFYALYSNGKLLLKGTGDMYDYTGSLDTPPNSSPFYNNQNITRIVVSDGITSIGDHAFKYCNALETAALPTTLTKIGDMAFFPDPDESAVPTTAKGLRELIIPDSVTTIEYGVFINTRLTSVVVPRTVTSIGTRVFETCIFLTTVRYGAPILNEFMFTRCTRLENVTLARTVTEIKSHCFNYCDALTQITYEGSLEDWAAVIKRANWDGNSGSIGPDGLDKVICLDGYMEYDRENHEWKVGEE